MHLQASRLVANYGTFLGLVELKNTRAISYSHISFAYGKGEALPFQSLRAKTHG